MKKHLLAIIVLGSIAALCAARALNPPESPATQPGTQLGVVSTTRLAHRNPRPSEQLIPPPTPAPIGVRDEVVTIAFAPQGYKLSDVLYTDGHLISVSDQGYVHLRNDSGRDILIPTGNVVWIERGLHQAPTEWPTTWPTTIPAQ